MFCYGNLVRSPPSSPCSCHTSFGLNAALNRLMLQWHIDKDMLDRNKQLQQQEHKGNKWNQWWKTLANPALVCLGKMYSCIPLKRPKKDNFKKRDFFTRSCLVLSPCWLSEVSNKNMKTQCLTSIKHTVKCLWCHKFALLYVPECMIHTFGLGGVLLYVTWNGSHFLWRFCVWQLKNFKTDNAGTGFGSGTLAVEQSIERTMANIKWLKENKQNVLNWFENEMKWKFLFFTLSLVLWSCIDIAQVILEIIIYIKWNCTVL